MDNTYSSYEWFLKADLANYAGKWLAIIDKKIVGSGNNVEDLINSSKKRYPLKKIIVTKVNDKLSIL